VTTVEEEEDDDADWASSRPDNEFADGIGDDGGMSSDIVLFLVWMSVNSSQYPTQITEKKKRRSIYSFFMNAFSEEERWVSKCDRKTKIQIEESPRSSN
jgi:hypothetical protein